MALRLVFLAQHQFVDKINVVSCAGAASSAATGTTVDGPSRDSKPGRLFPNPGFGFGRPQTRVSGSGFATLKSRRQADDVHGMYK